MNTRHHLFRSMSLALTVPTRPYLSQTTPTFPGIPGPALGITPSGLRSPVDSSQGNACLATLGWRPQFLRNWSAAFLVGTLLSGICVQAQTYSLEWFTIAGGGGTSAGGNFAVRATVGQAEANAQATTGGNFSLLGGFWSVFAVQTPGAPQLTITLNPQYPAVTISWPSSSTGFILQESAEFNGATWAAVPQAVNNNGANKFIIVNPSEAKRFYRLFKP